MSGKKKAAPRKRKAKGVLEFLAAPVAIDLDKLRRALLRGSMTAEEVAAFCASTKGQAIDAIDALRHTGANVLQAADRWSIQREPLPVDTSFRSVSDAQGRHRFGVISDTHYGSKYAREDVCDALYDWFAAENVSVVYHAGNWIDGEARFNKYDLIREAHGMQAQLDYFVERYPRRAGIETRYVTGDDHEGWYAQREGVDIGKMLEDTAKRTGRTDLVHLGYMEAFITLEHTKTKKHSRLLVMHPGGGSAYATSYAPQKIVEAFQPGEKPGIVILGHYHKLEYLNIRGVHSIQAGCTKDLDPFGRKKRLQYHIGGWVVDAWQDEGGAVTRVRPDLMQFFDRGYYNDQFDPVKVVRRMKVRA
jgi:predicted phosphodiesterase